MPTFVGSSIPDQAERQAYSAGKNNENIDFNWTDFSPLQRKWLRIAFGDGVQNIDEPTCRLHFKFAPRGAAGVTILGKDVPEEGRMAWAEKFEATGGRRLKSE